MRKIIYLLLLSVCLAACVSLPQGRECSANKQAVSFFAHEEKLLAFRFQAHWKAYQLDGILQLKQLEKDHYEALVFSAAGGYRLLKATIGPKNIEYQFYVASADRAVLRAKLTRLFRSLLAVGNGPLQCRKNQSSQTASYGDKKIGKYIYSAGDPLPAQLIYTKGWTHGYLIFQKYNMETYKLPIELIYREGGVQIELFLVSVKK